jgi:hypothetical protein
MGKVATAAAALVLSACGFVLPTGPDAAFPFPVQCEDETGLESSQLTCGAAVQAAVGELGFLIDSVVVEADFHRHAYCPPGSYCPVIPPNAGYVVLRIQPLPFQRAAAERILVRVIADDEGHVDAGPIETFPPN